MISEIIYGIHTVQALLKQDPQRFLNVYLVKGRANYRSKILITQLIQAGIVIQMVSRQWIDKEFEGAVHQGIVALIKSSRKLQECDLLDLLAQHGEPLLLVLDGITDPHNLGACLRCANAAGVHAVIVPRDRSAKLNATVKKVASGAAEIVPLIRVTNLVRTLQLLRKHNVWIVGTASEVDRHFYQSKLTGSLALVMGAENKGMRHLTRKCCDEFASIPMDGVVTSLNVSVAAGIFLFESVRQRIQKNIMVTSCKS